MIDIDTVQTVFDEMIVTVIMKNMWSPTIHTPCKKMINGYNV